MELEQLQEALKQFRNEYQSHLKMQSASLKEAVAQCMLFHIFKTRGYTVVPEFSVNISIKHGKYENQASDTTRTLSIDLLVNSDTPIEVKIKKIKETSDAIDLPHDQKENGELRWIGDDRKLRYLTSTRYEQGYAIVINKGTADVTVLSYAKGLLEIFKS